jgi:hypothetical protein
VDIRPLADPSGEREFWRRSYLELAEALSPEWRAALRDRPAPPELAILAGQELQWFPWDGVLLASLRDGLRLAEPPPAIYRALPPAERYEPRGRPNPGRPVHIISGRSWASLLRSAWGKIPDLAWDPELSRANLRELAPQVLHLVGRPVRSRGGFLQQLDDAEPSRPESQSSTRVTGSGDIQIREVIGAQGPTRGGNHVQTRDLPLHSLQMVVVQAPPVDRPDREVSDRLAAAYLRAFAAELHAAGIGIVLAVPSLPAEAVAAVLQPLVLRIAAGELPVSPTAADLKPFLRFLPEMQVQVQTQLDTLARTQPAPRTRTRAVVDSAELAYDLCLYLREPLFS